jgi:hypothetical protein
MLPNKVKIYISLIAVSLLVIVFTYYLINVNTGSTKPEILKTIKQLESETIEYYQFIPTAHQNSLVKDTLFISNRNSIESLTNALTQIEKFSPNHPMTEWNLKIKIKFKEVSLSKFCIEITQSDERDGTCLWIIKESFWGDFNLGEYRNDRLKSVIETILKEN